MRQHHQASMTARRKHVSVVYLPSVNMRSSQQLCLSTAPLQLSPVLSAMVPEVPVVRMLSGRDGDSWGLERHECEAACRHYVRRFAWSRRRIPGVRVGGARSCPVAEDAHLVMKGRGLKEPHEQLRAPDLKCGSGRKCISHSRPNSQVQGCARLICPPGFCTTALPPRCLF